MSEQRAVALVHAVGTGTLLTLLGQPAERRDPGLSITAREAVVAAMTGEAAAPAQPGPAGAAMALRAAMDRTAVLTSGERHLLAELLDRIADDD